VLNTARPTGQGENKARQKNRKKGGEKERKKLMVNEKYLAGRVLPVELGYVALRLTVDLALVVLLMPAWPWPTF